MLALLGLVAFILASIIAFVGAHLTGGAVGFIALGLALVTAHQLYPVGPTWGRTRP